MLNDPDELRRSMGMPDTPLTRDASKFLVRALRDDRKSKHGVPQVCSRPVVQRCRAAHASHACVTQPPVAPCCLAYGRAGALA